MKPLHHRHALVTGGGSGIGAAVALAFAREGAAVTIAGRRQSSLKEVAASSPLITAVTADVTREESVAAMFEQVGVRPVDIVVAAAGAAHSAPLARTDMALWEQMIAVNLTGVFLTFREAIRHLGERPWGRLIAIASTAGQKGYAYVSPYCAAKHGVIGLTRALALETARTGTTINAICPGFTQTPLLESSIKTIVDKTGKSTEQARAALAATNPTGRFVQPEEVAQAALWLCGPHSASVTGQAIGISGGEV